VVSYLSARTGRALPVHFTKNGERLEIRARHAVGINESNAHFEAALAGLGIIQTFITWPILISPAERWCRYSKTGSRRPTRSMWSIRPTAT
jgi:hypothetical protein